MTAGGRAFRFKNEKETRMKRSTAREAAFLFAYQRTVRDDAMEELLESAAEGGNEELALDDSDLADVQSNIDQLKSSASSRVSSIASSEVLLESLSMRLTTTTSLFDS